jgi:5-hydroxyisourate hydrolase
MAKLSTHVLDVVNGCPAAGVSLVLYRVTAAGREKVIAAVTNADGRTDAPLLSGDSIATGVYEIDFEAGDYFRARGIKLPEPAFVDRVTLRFGIAEGRGNYHVPLLASPWSYSTYRGS